MEVGLARLARSLGQRDESVIKCHVFIRKFHPVYRDNFAVLTLFKQLLKIANSAVFDLSPGQLAEKQDSSGHYAEKQDFGKRANRLTELSRWVGYPASIYTGFLVVHSGKCFEKNSYRTTPEALASAACYVLNARFSPNHTPV